MSARGYRSHRVQAGLCSLAPFRLISCSISRVFRGRTCREPSVRRWIFLSGVCVFFLSQVSGGIQKELEKEVLYYDYRASFFDIFVSSSGRQRDHFLSLLWPRLFILFAVSPFLLITSSPPAAPGCLQVCHPHPGLRRL